MSTIEVTDLVAAPTRETETSDISPYVEFQPQLTFDSPLNKFESNELRKRALYNHSLSILKIKVVYDTLDSNV